MKVLISRTDRLGDLVLALPVAQVLKEKQPNWKIYFYVRMYQAPLLLHHTDVDGSLIYKPESSIKEMVNLLKSHEFDVVLDLFPRFRPALIFALARIPRRIGTFYRWFSIFYTDKVKIHRKPSIRHEAEYNLMLLEPLKIKAKLIKPKLYLTHKEEAWGQRMLANLPQPVVALHPSSGSSAPNWDYDRYIMLAKLLTAKGMGVILTGKPGPSFPLDNNILDMRGKTTLRQLMAILKNVSILVSNSTGPMHIACALDTPTVSLFYPEGVAGPTRWGPLHPLSIVLTSEPGDQHLESISIDEVFAAVEKILESSG